MLCHRFGRGTTTVQSLLLSSAWIHSATATAELGLSKYTGAASIVIIRAVGAYSVAPTTHLRGDSALQLDPEAA
jgi:hypothetical protein